ncbi:hypothetical protein ACQP00_19845 [Dactylosporangium sp. CS-047395]|uniref:hypothetical protein n=1 Tax=Dactylosporangium sp. CS-047395 TaxID=3239936 RepID=UPI003D8CD108
MPKWDRKDVQRAVSTRWRANPRTWATAAQVVVADLAGGNTAERGERVDLALQERLLAT